MAHDCEKKQSCADFIFGRREVVRTRKCRLQRGLFGREEILTPVDKITQENVVRVLAKAAHIHQFNSMQIDYLYRYMKGEQPVLKRVKKIRPEICNKIVENHAAEITQFTSGYFLGEPLTYIPRGDREGLSECVDTLNDYMFWESKASQDKQIATWMAIAGNCYRMTLPKKVTASDKEPPFKIDVCDPRYTFVVYHSGFGKKPVMGVQEIFRENDQGLLVKYLCGYTQDHYFEVEGNTLKRWEGHTMRDIPIVEYRLNASRMGAFEPALPLLDAINNIQSNRVDGVEQFIQSFLKFKNCEVDDDAPDKLRAKGAIAIKSIDGVLDADVDIITQELNQEQVQTLVDYMYDQVLVICGMPTTTKGGASTSDTGQAVFLRDGWSQCEARAKDTETLFKESEKNFLRLALHIIHETRDLEIDLHEVDYKFTRRQHDNLQNKTQALLSMLQAGLKPEIAIAACGLFNDPVDVAKQSEKYLKKWEYVEMTAKEGEDE